MKVQIDLFGDVIISMTREEAIKRLKGLKARCERLSVSSGTDPMKWRADAEAVGMAIAALKEREARK